MQDLYFSYRETKSGGEICEGEENDSWPNHEDEYIEWHLLKCVLEKPVWPYEIVRADFKVETGDKIHAVCVRYTGGGSFITTHGNGTIEGVYRTIEEATTVEQSIYKNTYEGYTPWRGHFESLESCYVETMIVEDK